MGTISIEGAERSACGEMETGEHSAIESYKC